MIIAGEMSAPLRISSGPAIQHAGDLAAILSGLAEGEVFFLDEIHRMSRPAEEMLYLAMEDFRVDVVVGKGPGATAIPLEIPRFTLVGATTRAGLLPGPLRDRFGFTAQLDFYDAAALEHIVRRSAELLGAQRRDAGRGRGDRPPLPRHAPDRQPAAAPGPGLRPGPRRRPGHHDRRPGRAGAVRGGRARAWTGWTGRCWTAMCRRFGGGPVGLSTLAISVGEERETVEEVAEPFLVRQGFLMRTPRGRVATAAAWRHLGLTPPGGDRSAPTPDVRISSPDGRVTWGFSARLGRVRRSVPLSVTRSTDRPATPNRMPEPCRTIPAP